MKINILFAVMALLAIWQTSTATLRDPNNPPTGRTGAPSETTCQASGCHSGGSYTGTVSISGVPDTIAPNTTYTVTLTNTSNAVRAGFELTCLDSANVKCGTLTAGTGCSTTTAGGRQYVRQASPKTLSNGSTSWTFTWKSPVTAAGNSATFYFVSLAANGNGKESGDKVLQANKKVVLQQLVATNEPAVAFAGVYATPQNMLHVNLLNAYKGQLTVFDLQGKMVEKTTLEHENQLDMNHLNKGMYLAQVQAEGRSMTKKFMVQ